MTQKERDGVEANLPFWAARDLGGQPRLSQGVPLGCRVLCRLLGRLICFLKLHLCVELINPPSPPPVLHLSSACCEDTLYEALSSGLEDQPRGPGR